MLSTDNGEAAVAQPTGPKLLSLESFGDASFGLRQNALSPMETLAQSVSTIAPSTSPPVSYTHLHKISRFIVPLDRRLRIPRAGTAQNRPRPCLLSIPV